MLIESGDLIPVKREAVDIPWTKRKTQIMSFLHKGPVNFKTYVYDTNVGDIAPLSTYFNPQKWTVHDLNFKFGTSASEKSLNVNSSGNSSSSSTAGSFSSSPSNPQKNSNAGKDGEELSSNAVKSSSLQPRLMLIPAEPTDTAPKNSEVNVNSQLMADNEGSKSNSPITTITPRPNSVSTFAPKYASVVASVSQSNRAVRSASLTSTPLSDQAERTKRWVTSIPTSMQENDKSKFQHNCEECVGAVPKKVKTCSSSQQSFREEWEKLLLNESIIRKSPSPHTADNGTFKHKQEKVTEYERKTISSGFSPFVPLTPSLKLNEKSCNRSCLLKQFSKLTPPAAISLEPSFLQDVPKITCTDVEGGTTNSIDHDKVIDSVFFPTKSQNALSYNTIPEQSFNGPRYNGWQSEQQKDNHFINSEVSPMEQILNELQCEELPAVHDVLSRYGIKRRSASLADLPAFRQAHKMEPIGPPKHQRRNVDHRFCSTSNFNSSTTHYPPTSHQFLSKDFLSSSPTSTFDDVFDNQNVTLRNGILGSTLRKPFNSTSIIEDSLYCKDDEHFDGLQCQHELGINKNSRIMPLQLDASLIFGNPNFVSPFWKNVEESLGDKSPSFFSPWSINSTTIPTSARKSPTNFPKTELEGLNERTHDNMLLIEPPPGHKRSSPISPSLSSGTHSALEENIISLTGDSNEELRGMSSNSSRVCDRNPDFRTLEQQCDSITNYINRSTSTERKDNATSTSSSQNYQLDSKHMNEAKSGEPVDSGYLDEHFAARLGLGEEFTLFDNQRGSSFFELWTTGRSNQTYTGERLTRSPENVEASGVQTSFKKETTDDSNCLEGIDLVNLVETYKSDSSNVCNDDTQQFVRNLRKLAGENIAEDIANE